MSDVSPSLPPARYYLSKAAWSGNIGAIHQLLQRGYSIEENAGGRTPFLWAVSSGRKIATDLMIAKGADIFKRTADGDNALICAVRGDNPEIVQMMVDKGFDPDEKGSRDKSAMDRAEEGGNAEILKILEEVVAPRRRIAAEQEKARAEEARHATSAAAHQILQGLMKNRHKGGPRP